MDKKQHCCESMTFHANYRCKHHDIYECPDNVIDYNVQWDEYGIIIHDGGTSSYTIKFCPWCGKKLPPSKSKQWAKKLKALGIKDPFSEKIPEEFTSDKWYRSPLQ